MNRKKTMKREYQAYLYILPWILGFVILQLYPFVSSFIYSFTDYTVGAKATFQGLANYKKLFLAGFHMLYFEILPKSVRSNSFEFK